jgi:hypothetical protein
MNTITHPNSKGNILSSFTSNASVFDLLNSDREEWILEGLSFYYFCFQKLKKEKQAIQNLLDSDKKKHQLQLHNVREASESIIKEHKKQ